LFFGPTFRQEIGFFGPTFRQSRPELYYLHREKKGSNAEVDYVFEKDGKIIPIEVKSGMQGKMQSLFLELKNQVKVTKFFLKASLNIKVLMAFHICYWKIA
jgi:predicted AAA+ superfamily ATPase